MTQGIEEQIGTVAAIESKLHLFEIGRKMLGAKPMPCSHDAALEKREGGFNCIGVNVAHDVHAGTVVNLLVGCPLGFPHCGIVCGRIVSEDYFHVLGNVLADILSERPTFRVSGMEKSE